jgi:hypothetical protein
MESREEKCSTLEINSEKENRLVSEGFFNNTLSVKQPEKGYRFSIDALMLAHQVNPNGISGSWTWVQAVVSSR